MPFDSDASNTEKGEGKEQQGTARKILSKFKETVKHITTSPTPNSSTTTNTTATTISETSSSTPSVNPPLEETHTLGLISLGKVAKVFYDNRKELEDQIEPVRKCFEKVAKKMTQLNAEFNKELDFLYPPAEEKDPHGQKKIALFFNHLLALIHNFNTLISPTGDIDASKEAKKITQEIKDLLDEFESLNLEAIFNQYIPDSWEQLKKKALKEIDALITKKLFRIQAEATKIEAEIKTAYHHAGYALSVDEFQKLSHPVKDFILISMEGALTLYQKSILMLDKLEVQFGFREGALLQILKWGYPAEEMKPAAAPQKDSEKAPDKTDKKKPSDYTKAIIKIFEELTNQYQILIKARGFPAIELFPYFYSKLESRKKLQQHIECDLNLKAEEYKNITKNIRIAVTTILVEKELFKTLGHFELNKDEAKLILPDQILTASEATKWKKELSEQLIVLKKIIKKHNVPKEERKAILAYHKKVCTVLRDLEFYLLEKERIEKIMTHSSLHIDHIPPRQLQPAETIQSLKTECVKVIKRAEPYFNGNSDERKQLTTYKIVLNKKRMDIENIFDPVFIKHAEQQFIAERAESERLRTSYSPMVLKGSGEEKDESISAHTATVNHVLTQLTEESKSIENTTESIPEVKQTFPPFKNSAHLKPDNPFTLYSHNLLISILRGLDSLNIVLKLTAKNNPHSKAMSPGEALAEDIAKANDIMEHVDRVKSDYSDFLSFLHDFVLDQTSAVAIRKIPIVGENEEEKHNSPSDEDVLTPLAQCDAEKNFIAEFKKRVCLKFDEKLSSMSTYLVNYKNNWLDSDKEAWDLVIFIINRVKELVPEFATSYSDYLHPPTLMTHIKTVLNNSHSLYSLISKLDKLTDIISGARISVPLEILYYANQCIMELFLFVDQLEIYFYLKQGFISNNLREFEILTSKDKKINLDSLMRTLKDKLASFHCEFLSEHLYPYTGAVLKNRHKMLESQDSSDLVKAIITNRSETPSSAGFLENHNDDKNPNAYWDDVDNFALTNKDAHLLFESKLGDDLKSEINKTKLMTELDLAINQLKQKRNGWFLSRKNLEKRIILLEAFRRIIRKEGYTIENTSKELTAPKWESLLATDRSLINKLRHIEDQIPITQRMKRRILPRKIESKHPISLDGPIIQEIKDRISELKRNSLTPFNNITQRLLLTNLLSLNNVKKRLLLNTLLETIEKKKVSFTHAMQMVKQKYPNEAYLLYDGKTGEMIREIERRTSRSRIIKSSIKSQRLSYFSTEQRPYLKKYIIQETAENIHLLKKIKENPNAVIESNQEKILKNIAPDLLPLRLN